MWQMLLIYKVGGRLLRATKAFIITMCEVRPRGKYFPTVFGLSPELREVSMHINIFMDSGTS